MVRAAAKNFAAVAVLVDPERYGFVLDELRESAGDLSLDTRRELAAEAFAHTAGYDIAIANWFSDAESFPERHLSELVKVDRPRRTARTRTSAPPTTWSAARAATCSRWCTSTAASSSRSTTCSTSTPAATLAARVHAAGLRDRQARQPVRRARSPATPEEAYRKALAADPVSAFGGVVAVNRPLTRELAELLAEQFVEVLHAPGYDEGAVDLLRERSRTCACSRVGRAAPADAGRARLPPRDRRPPGPGPATRESEDRDMMDGRRRRGADRARVGRPAVRLARRQARALERHRDRPRPADRRHRRRARCRASTPSRLALDKALAPVAGAVLASDAFFPFADGVAGRARRGRARRSSSPAAPSATTRSSPPSRRAGGTLVFTGRRHFSH